jgi:hypothetical protein
MGCGASSTAATPAAEPASGSAPAPSVSGLEQFLLFFWTPAPDRIVLIRESNEFSFVFVVLLVKETSKCQEEACLNFFRKAQKEYPLQ